MMLPVLGCHDYVEIPVLTRAPVQGLVSRAGAQCRTWHAGHQ